jgi:membrane protease YdiL (CAAX protease family)
MLTLICVTLAYVGGQLPLQFAVHNAVDSRNVDQDLIGAFYETLDFSLLGIDLRLGLLLLLAGHLFAGVALLACNSLIHRRPTRWLFTSFARLRWGRSAWAFIVWMLLLTILELVMYTIDPGNYFLKVDFGRWLSLLPFILLLIPLQTTVEELLFRGYLLPRIAGAARSALFGVVLTAGLFALLHMGNPEVSQFGVPVMIIYYVLVGLFLGALAIADGGLELAIGIHAATNIYGAAFVGFEGSVLQLGAPVHITDVDPWAMTLGFTIMIGVFSLLTHRKYQINLVSSLFINMDPESNQEN